MSLSFSDDLFCREDSSITVDETEDTLRLDFPEDVEETIAGSVEEESSYSPGFDYPTMFKSPSLNASAREQSVTWILKVQAFYRFQPLTAYLAVNYMDRFLSAHRWPQVNGWPLQLLTVACLSLAVKMEETIAPSLLDLQVEDPAFIFDPKTVRRMEFLVLNALKWRLRSVTPFTFLEFFCCKIDSSGNFIKFLIPKATQIILFTIKGIDFLDSLPSTIAASAVLCVANEVLNLSLVDPEIALSWCSGLSKDRMDRCYQLMRKILMDDLSVKPTKILPQLRVCCDPCSSLSSNKRRKLNTGFSEDEVPL